MLPDTILGISLSTNRLGLAIWNKGELTHWQVKGFDETYSKKKMKRIWRTIEMTIERHGVSVIGMKLPPKYTYSDGVSQSLKYITAKVLEKGITIYFYDLEAIGLHFLKSKLIDKSKLAECISDTYPQLKHEFLKLSKCLCKMKRDCLKLSKCHYHMKIFEAVGAMELALLELLNQ